MAEKEKPQRLNSQVMDLEQLIAAPLVATLKADTMMTASYVEFLREVAFESDGSGNLGKLRTFSFKYEQNDRDGKGFKSVQVPVISLIPIPLLQIKEAKFDFDIRILDSVTETTEREFSFERENHSPAENDDRMSVRATLSPQSGKASKTKDASMSANMKVNVVMKQADMPAGLANLLSLSAHNMTVENGEEDIADSPRPLPEN
ncbi:MAG: DUF2589 domain-containing protein [Alistipes sp.]|nr:DUF2589 domain-containing protein [Alistipes sp.]